MKKHYFSIPVFFDLTSSNNWNKIDVSGAKFFVMRSHFMMKTREIEGKVRKGGIIQAFQKPGNVETERMVSIEIEKEYIKFEEMFTQMSFERELLEEFITKLKPGIAGESFGLNLSAKMQFAQKLKERYANSLRTTDTIRETKRMTLELKYTFNSKFTGEAYHVKAYQKFAFDIYLSYVDYLFVDYKSSMAGLRRKRGKLPKIDKTNPARHRNVLKLNAPLATVHFWKLLAGSAIIVPADKYKNEVPDPDEFKVVEPEDIRQHHVEFPDLPSLYQLSNKAFPLRWVDIKGGLTKEDLMKIEEEDYSSKFFPVKKWVQNNRTAPSSDL
jgi:hypothetical protein